jgi:SAM-dependent methyltransferase
MSYEASKAMARRGEEFRKFFKGSGIDVGCGPDSVARWKKKFPIRNVREWDLADGDGELLASVSDNSVNWVHSSHSLEHMRSWSRALENWARVCIRGGYVICTVPSWEMYEHRTWPSRFNSDHKHAFSLVENGGPVVLLNKEVLSQFGDVILLREITDGYDPNDYSDQTQGAAECCIEFVLRTR